MFDNYVCTFPVMEFLDERNLEAVPRSWISNIGKVIVALYTFIIFIFREHQSGMRK